MHANRELLLIIDMTSCLYVSLQMHASDKMSLCVILIINSVKSNMKNNNILITIMPDISDN